MGKVDLLGVHIDGVDHLGIQQSIEESVGAGQKKVIAYVNVHAVNIAQKNPRFRHFLNRCDLVYCDGEGIRLGAWLLGHHLPRRTVLTYFVWELCEFFEKRGISIFLLGSLEDRVEEAASLLKARLPRLRILGWHHGYFEKMGAASDQVVECINAVHPDVLFVGFGMPVQEQWIEDNMKRLEISVALPCGSMIDYVSGMKSLAPRWMSHSGLEWLYRLYEEPRRLWRRYLIGNPAFALRVLGQRVGLRRVTDEE